MPIPPAAILGQSFILHRAYAKQDLTALTQSLTARALTASPDPGAMMDLATVLQARGVGWTGESLALQRAAVAINPSYVVVHGDGSGPCLLALVTPGDFMANTPVDFLLEGSNARLILHYVTEATEGLTLPPHDVAMMAIGESPENAAVLARMARLTAGMDMLNNAPGFIATLARDTVSARLADQPHILAPRTHRLTRADLLARRFPAGLGFPMLLRPLGSHAGIGLDQIIDDAELGQWLAEHDVAEVYAVPFVDYRGPDGLYSKQRVVLIKGRPYASHLAASDHWMVHYLNADMTLHASRRGIEAAWMANFDTYATRHAEAFAALHRLFPLDYFGIDCAEAPDGRLLVFELDVAMIVHDMDDEGMFPYKKPAMNRLFRGFMEMVEARSGETVRLSDVSKINEISRVD